MKKNHINRIIHYGLSESEVDIIRQASPDAEVFEAGCCEDIIAHYAELAVINPENLDSDEAKMLSGFYREIDSCEEHVILIKPHENFKKISFVKVFPEFMNSVDTARFKIMELFKDTAKQADFSRRIANAIQIMKMIENNPGITTKDIGDKLEMENTSVRRYIRSLQAAFIPIEYTGKGWRCYAETDDFFKGGI